MLKTAKLIKEIKERTNGKALCTNILKEIVLKCSYYNFIVVMAKCLRIST